VPAAPAVHFDRIWDADKLVNGELTNLDVVPIPASDMTKREYFAELNKRGLRMKDQAESTTGPEVDFEALAATEAAAVAARQQIVAPDPFTKREAEVVHAYTAFLARFHLIETLDCDRCLRADRHPGCKTIVTPRLVRVTCRCGDREYQAPAGTTDLPVQFGKLNVNDNTTSIVVDDTGQPRRLQTVLLTREHVDVVLAYARLLTDNRLAHTLYCADCFGGRFTDLTAVRESVAPDQIVLLCQCRLRFYQG
jgi:hypothetical protein